MAIPTKLVFVPTIEIDKIVVEAVDRSMFQRALNSPKQSHEPAIKTLCYGILGSLGMAFKKELKTTWLF